MVFGPEWLPAVPPLQILSLNGLRLALVRLHAYACEARGHPRAGLIVIGAQVALGAPASIIAARFGIVWVAVAFTVTGWLVMPLSFVFLAPHHRCRLRAPVRGAARHPGRQRRDGGHRDRRAARCSTPWRRPHRGARRQRARPASPSTSLVISIVDRSLLASVAARHQPSPSRAEAAS